MFVKATANALGLEKYVSLGQVLLDDFKNVKLAEKNLNLDLSLETKEKIAEKWKKHLEKNPNDFDGDLGSVISILNLSNSLKIIFRKGKFSQFFATESNRKQFININNSFLDKETCLPLSFGAIAITKPEKNHLNGYIVFAKRSKTAFDRGKITLLPGGYFDPSKDYFLNKKLNKSYLIEITIIRELFEETNLYLNSVKPEFLGLVYNKKGSKQPLIAVLIKLPFTKKELIKMINIDEENKEIFFVNNNIKAVKKFLKNKELAIHDAWKLILYFNKMSQ
jgi:8-oxo-dGTP pyrophosphatase MutT (NUDIX family)